MLLRNWQAVPGACRPTPEHLNAGDEPLRSLLHIQSCVHKVCRAECEERDVFQQALSRRNVRLYVEESKSVELGLRLISYVGLNVQAELKDSVDDPFNSGVLIADEFLARTFSNLSLDIGLMLADREGADDRKDRADGLYPRGPVRLFKAGFASKDNEIGNDPGSHQHAKHVGVTQPFDNSCHSGILS